MRVATESKHILAPESSAPQPGDAFFELSQEFNDLISRRAYELFESRGSVDGHDREDWLQAVSEILVDVPMDVMETETAITVRADVQGFTEKELEVRVAARSVCISGRREETSQLKSDKNVSIERRSSQIFRTVELPSEIDPSQVLATLTDGVLEIKLSKVTLGKRVPVLAKAATA